MKLDSMQHNDEGRKVTRLTRTGRLKLMGAALAQTMVVALATVPQPAQAQAVDPLCMLGALPITPQPSAAKPYAWAFLANFDHPNSTTVTTVCFAERMFGGPVTYKLVACPIHNNQAGAQFGNGLARFNGSAYATCALTAATETDGPPFAVGTRATFPLAGTQYPIVTSSDIDFKVTRSAGCTLTPASRYNNLAFNHTSGAVGCAGLHRVFSKIEQTQLGVIGVHRVNGVDLVPTAPMQGGVLVPRDFTLQLGAPVGAYNVDYIVIDPRGGSCCGGG